MLIERRNNLLMIADARKNLHHNWIFATVCFLFAGLIQIGPAHSTVSLVFTGIFVVMGLAGVCNPLRRTEIDRRSRQVRISNRWAWGSGHTQTIGFDEIAGTDVHASTGGEGPDIYSPRLLLKSGKTVRLAQTDSASNADDAIKTVLAEIRSKSP